MSWFNKPKADVDITEQAAQIIEEASAFQRSKDALKSALDSIDLHYDEVGGPTGNVIAFPVTESALGTVMVIAALDGDGESMQLKFQLQGSVPENKLPQLYEILNKCNASYRWAKMFIVTENGNRLMMDCDIAWDGAASETVILGAFIRCMEVAKRAHPEIMRGIWG